jgi:hypothetical protein
MDDFVTGGGYLEEHQSEGKYATDKDFGSNFGYNGKFNKRKTNLQANANIILRKDGEVFRIKANIFN